MRVWVGKRESDILESNYFNYSITFWGSNTDNNFAFCKNNRIAAEYSTQFIAFIYEHLSCLLSIDKDLEIHFYNSSIAYKLLKISPELKSNCRNLNNQFFCDQIRHKTLSRLWLSNIVSVPPYASVSKSECNLGFLQRLFGKYDSFVIQKNYSGGGTGTYLLSTQNSDIVEDKLKSGVLYLASPYLKNSISASCTILIDDNQCIAFPATEQLLHYTNEQISYCGNKFYDNKSFLSKIIRQQSIAIGNLLCKQGYRGICGIDYLIQDKKLMLIEINPRFQGSSLSFDKTLNILGLPSLYELNTLCFQNQMPNISSEIDNMCIPFENHFVFNISGISEPNNIIKKYTDGFEFATKCEQNVYLYRYFSL